MKKTLTIALILLILCTLSGCSDQGGSAVMNPWQSFDTLAEAEESAGVALGMPETIAGTYKAVSFRVLTGDKPMLEVIYEDADCRVTVRKVKGKGREISGVYGFEHTETVKRGGAKIKTYRPLGDAENPNAVLHTFDYDGCSWSLYAPEGYSGDSCEDFLNAVFEK